MRDYAIQSKHLLSADDTRGVGLSYVRDDCSRLAEKTPLALNSREDHELNVHSIDLRALARASHSLKFNFSRYPTLSLVSSHGKFLW